MKATTIEKPQNSLAFQHNHLIRTPLKMTLVEARIFVYALGQIHQTDKVFKAIEIPLSSIVGDNTNGEAYKAVHEGCKALVRQILNVLPANSRRGDLQEVPLMAGIKLDTGTGVITGQFNELAKPYLLDLKDTKNFTSANITNLLTFTNPNSARLYWILLSFRNLDSPTHTVTVPIELDLLKLWMLKKGELYPLYTEFKRRILDPIAEDFKRIKFNATWKPHKTGKKTTALMFTVPKDKSAPKPKAPASSIDTTTEDFKQFLTNSKDRNLRIAYAGLREKNQLTDASAQAIIRYVANNPDKQALFYQTRHKITIHKEPIANMRSFTLKALNVALGTDFK